jgi:hypothetical protein
VARLLLAPAILLLSPLTACAHSLGAECKVQGQRGEVEAFFSDDTAAPSAKVVVRDQAKVLVAEGTTDAEGRWTFARPAAGTYDVVVDAGGGHRATVTLIVPDPAAGQTVEAFNSGPSRAEFTRTPWGPIFAGLALIALPAGILWLWLRRSRESRPIESQTPSS